jgi:hypothetical protein
VGSWDRGMGIREEDPWSAEMSEVGRSHCRAPNAGMMHLIDRNRKLGEYSVSMELSEITVDWREKSTSLSEGHGRIRGDGRMCEPAIRAGNIVP